jgi:hypothetical protein
MKAKDGADALEQNVPKHPAFFLAGDERVE